MQVKLERKTLLKHYVAGHNVWKIMDGHNDRVVNATEWEKDGKKGFTVTDGEIQASLLHNQVVILS